MAEPAADEAGAAEAVTAPAPVPIAPVLFKARGRGKAKASMRKRSPTPPPAPVNDSDDSSDDSSDDRSDGGAAGDRAALREAQRRARRNKAGVVQASTDVPVRSSGEATGAAPHVADRQALLADNDTATKRSHMFDDKDSGAAGGSSKKAKKNDGTAAAPTAATAPAAGTTRPTPGSGVGGGVAGTAVSRSVGPLKTPGNVRTITFTDFAPDVCKDYKQTGFCGFGDNCKFLHAREDYKQGWQMENEWEAVTKGKKNLGGTVVASADRHLKNAAAGGAAAAADDEDDDDEEAMLRDIPFACILCREGYKQPVVTRCGHYFCERCALGRYRRDPTCAACGTATTGVFNSAKRLAKLLDRKRERAAKRRQAAIEAGEEVSSDEEGGDEE